MFKAILNLIQTEIALLKRASCELSGHTYTKAVVIRGRPFITVSTCKKCSHKKTEVSMLEPKLQGYEITEIHDMRASMDLQKSLSKKTKKDTVRG